MNGVPEQLIHILAGVGLFFLLLFIVAWLLVRLRGRPIVYPYTRRAVLSAAETRFFRVLEQCVPPGHVLLAKVRLADFLEVTVRGSERLSWFGRISQKHTDFLLVDATSGMPRVAIELDDDTHRHNQRTLDSDAFKEGAYRAAGVTLLRIPVKPDYDPAHLRRIITEALAAEERE